MMPSTFETLPLTLSNLLAIAGSTPGLSVTEQPGPGRDHEQGPKVRRTRPVRGFGPNDVDLRGTRSPCAAIRATVS